MNNLIDEKIAHIICKCGYKIQQLKVELNENKEINNIYDEEHTKIKYEEHLKECLQKNKSWFKKLFYAQH